MRPTLISDLRSWLIESYGLDAQRVKDEEPLFSSGWLDSFNFIELVAEFERLSGCRVGPLELTLENFDSLAQIDAYADRKLAARSPISF